MLGGLKSGRYLSSIQVSEKRLLHRLHTQLLVVMAFSRNSLKNNSGIFIDGCL